MRIVKLGALLIILSVCFFEQAFANNCNVGVLRELRTTYQFDEDSTLASISESFMCEDKYKNESGEVITPYGQGSYDSEEASNKCESDDNSYFEENKLSIATSFIDPRVVEMVCRNTVGLTLSARHEGDNVIVTGTWTDALSRSDFTKLTIKEFVYRGVTNCLGSDLNAGEKIGAGDRTLTCTLQDREKGAVFLLSTQEGISANYTIPPIDITPPPAKGYFIKNTYTGKCIDVKGRPGLNSGSPIKTHTCELDGFDDINKAPTDQLWEIDGKGYITNVLSPSMCLDVKGYPGKSNSTKLQLWPCEYSGQSFHEGKYKPTDQKWRHSNSYIVNLNSNKCIDIGGRNKQSLGNDKNIQIYKCERRGQTDQKWEFIPHYE